MEISTSILNVEEELSTKTFYKLEEAHTDYMHIDIMDGEFVENNTVELMKKYADSLKNISNTPLDVHLMVKNVKQYVDMFAACNPSIISFHIEVEKSENITELIEYIKQANCKVGIAVNPETDVEEVFKYLPFIHLVLVMSVHPGKGGQKFIESTIEKIEKLKRYMKENNLENEIEVDGGVTDENITKIKNAGVDIATVGSFIIKSRDYKETINKLKNM